MLNAIHASHAAVYANAALLIIYLCLVLCGDPTQSDWDRVGHGGKMDLIKFDPVSFADIKERKPRRDVTGSVRPNGEQIS